MTADVAGRPQACPTDAITHGHGFELAGYATAALVRRRPDLLRPLS